ncbi:MAG: hypothetical protein J5586_00305 [Clostridia bacterium]|nr:hypothetical protein [Clostridia bacterium]
MKIWGRIKKDNRITSSKTITVQVKSASEIEDWSEPFAKLCHLLNLGRPVILSKHTRDLNVFGHTVFYPADFMEPVDFDRFEVELF